LADYFPQIAPPISGIFVHDSIIVQEFISKQLITIQPSSIIDRRLASSRVVADPSNTLRLSIQNTTFIYQNRRRRFIANYPSVSSPPSFP